MQIAEKIRAKTWNGKAMCLRITKIWKTQENDISTAFKIWYWAVVACNNGNANAVRVNFSWEKQEWDLGACSDLKLLVFPQCLKNYINGAKQDKEFGKMRGQIGYLMEKIKLMKDNVSEFFGGLEGMAKAKKMALIAANFAKLGYGASAADNFGDSFLGFKIELNAFFKNLEELKKQGAEKGK